MAIVLATAGATISHAADAPLDSTAALAKARALTPHVSRGEAGPLWTAFDDAMRAALGDSVRFDAMLTGIRVEFGTLKEVLDEAIARERTMWVYRARCRFERVEYPMTLLIAFAPDGRVAGLVIQPDATREYPTTKLDYQTKTRLDLPFRGEWFVFWGGRFIDDNYHAVSKSQRFAYDLVIVRNGSTHAGDGRKLTDYHCYGAEVLAPAAGTVVWSCDSLPDQEIGTTNTANPVGNGVVIDHGNGEFSLLAHLQPTSLGVKTGDRVAAGALVGLCGNSGNTSEPHIHYHLQDGPDILSAEGLPARFESIIVDGQTVPWAEPVRGQFIRRAK